MVIQLKSLIGFLALGLLLLVGKVSAAPGDRIVTGRGALESINTFHLKGLDTYRGLYATVFFVSGREAGLGLAGSRPRIRQVMKIEGPFEIHGGGELVSIPATAVARIGALQFNYVMIVVHSPYIEKIAIRNLDGSIPEGQGKVDTSITDDSSPFNHKDLFILKKFQVTSAEKAGKIIQLMPHTILP
ncbi:MAG: hypothetical protein A2X86_22155 [Bdellovibrionales bacterium GWA2_49_15]|nr:MAG: hypothetical protein A2X86_22155 [Bdellovibrionales bacterium GWA2_49_15]HAZ14818.1 hypothetical protein [Bdellovibrionales bacterium]